MAETIKRVYNLRRSSIAPSDYKLQDAKTKLNLPFSVDLSSKMSPVTNQQSLGICTSSAIVSGLREYLLVNIEKKPLIRLSRLYHYWHERELEGTLNEDSGATLRTGMNVIRDFGSCTESKDPFIPANFKIKPDNIEENEAKLYKVKSVFALRNLLEIQNCLTQGYPVVVGMEVFKYMESPEMARTGSLKLPKVGENPLGGHAVLSTGFQTNPLYPGGGYLIIRNSWGDKWGLKGYFKMPYAYITKGYCFDFWTARV